MISGNLQLLSLAALAPTALAGLHEVLDAVPGGWVVHDGPSTADSQPSTFTIALTMANAEKLESMLLDVSTPGNAKYGQFLDDESISKTFAPSPDVVAKITKWLTDGGVKHHQVDGSFVDFAADIPTVNKLLGADYKYYRNGDTTKLRTLQYSIPDDIQEYVQLVDPATFFGTPQAFVPQAPVERRANQPRGAGVDNSCSPLVTPGCLKKLYSVDDYTPNAASGSRVGFGSFLNQSAQYEDLFLFENEFGIARQSFDVELIANGKNNQSGVGPMGEANLDAQSIVGISHPLPVTEYITGGFPPFIANIDQPDISDNENEPYLPYFRYLLSQPISKLPQVISNSYGDVEDTVPRIYANYTCNMIGMLGLRGISVIESSGDIGVGSGCLAPDYKTVEFNPIFPASCPYVTAVGGTVGLTPETAWVGSSGGFSKYFSRPIYQERAIADYLKNVSSETYDYYGPYTNWKGRGFPDISAHSLGPAYAIYNGGKPARSGGTSAAAPVVAGVFGLLNDARLQAGQPALGWLNPLIYGWPHVFNDIVGGFSIGCDGNNTQSGQPEPPNSGIVAGARWNATRGWDPATGHGTPNFQRLKKLVLSL